ncbi:hypothetical protein BC830DRAFT_1156046 [Chytriomyces sp. MP71]|nr:hypothetical protein BC830DRAFT_1156046 [Chytriomyces sp. MP71]
MQSKKMTIVISSQVDMHHHPRYNGGSSSTSSPTAITSPPAPATTAAFNSRNASLNKTRSPYASTRNTLNRSATVLATNTRPLIFSTITMRIVSSSSAAAPFARTHAATSAQVHRAGGCGFTPLAARRSCTLALKSANSRATAAASRACLSRLGSVVVVGRRSSCTEEVSDLVVVVVARFATALICAMARARKRSESFSASRALRLASVRGVGSTTPDLHQNEPP